MAGHDHSAATARLRIATAHGAQIGAHPGEAGGLRVSVSFPSVPAAEV